jgi:hypothetical protein
MTAVKLVVTFNEHVSSNQVASMASSIAAYGNVLPGSSEREFVVEVFRATNAPSLRERLAQWEVHGLLRWVEDDSNYPSSRPPPRE